MAKSKAATPARSKKKSGPGKSPPAEPKLSITPIEDSFDPLSLFHPVTAAWLRAVFERPTTTQRLGWPAIAKGDSTLILAPTGTGKTLTAFLWCIDKLMLQPAPADTHGCRVIYISPLKALAVDVERNLRSPLAGIKQMAERAGVPVREPRISVRTGDTPQTERARFRRDPAEILITTPESLYLLLTSDAAASLRSVETVIVDEIHALVPTKRGAHLAVSLERLQALVGRPIQRIGLSATQRPLEEVAQFLGGVEVATEGAGRVAAPEPKLDLVSENVQALDTLEPEWLANSPDVSNPGTPQFRPVTIINASEPKRLDLRIEVPVEDMARLGQPEELPSGPASQGPKRTSIWTAIHPRLLELIREKQSTLIFVNSRRVAERLAGALNDLAEESIARAHHGSLAAAQRSEIEELLKAGRIRALVATSSLELGIDMGAIDLVIQIEAPPSVASGMQRIGRAGHHVGAVSDGIIFPKFRADLVACAAATRACMRGWWNRRATCAIRWMCWRSKLSRLWRATAEAARHQTRRKENKFAPGCRMTTGDISSGLRRVAPIDRQFCAVRHSESRRVRRCAGYAFRAISLRRIRGAAPAPYLGPCAQFVDAAPGRKAFAILNGGTIPDRGLYGVFLSSAKDKPVRVGELDEEMVFESHSGRHLYSWRDHLADR